MIRGNASDDRVLAISPIGEQYAPGRNQPLHKKVPFCRCSCPVRIRLPKSNRPPCMPAKLALARFSAYEESAHAISLIDELFAPSSIPPPRTWPLACRRSCPPRIRFPPTSRPTCMPAKSTPACAACQCRSCLYISDIVAPASMPPVHKKLTSCIDRMKVLCSRAEYGPYICRPNDLLICSIRCTQCPPMPYRIHNRIRTRVRTRNCHRDLCALRTNRRTWN